MCVCVCVCVCVCACACVCVESKFSVSSDVALFHSPCREKSGTESSETDTSAGIIFIDRWEKAPCAHCHGDRVGWCEGNQDRFT